MNIAIHVTNSNGNPSRVQLDAIEEFYRPSKGGGPESTYRIQVRLRISDSRRFIGPFADLDAAIAWLDKNVPAIGP